MVVYLRRLKAGLPGDALYAEEGSRNRLRNEPNIGAGIGAAMDRTEERIRRRETAVPPTLDEDAGLGADLHEIGAERHGIGAE